MKLTETQKAAAFDAAAGVAGAVAGVVAGRLITALARNNPAAFVAGTIFCAGAAVGALAQKKAMQAEAAAIPPVAAGPAQ